MFLGVFEVQRLHLPFLFRGVGIKDVPSDLQKSRPVSLFSLARYNLRTSGYSSNYSLVRFQLRLNSTVKSGLEIICRVCSPSTKPELAGYYLKNSVANFQPLYSDPRLLKSILNCAETSEIRIKIFIFYLNLGSIFCEGFYTSKNELMCYLNHSKTRTYVNN